jgi:TonB-dependent starch-binding outer membrane protein SusC
MSARSLVLAAGVVLSATGCASDGVTAPVAPLPQASIDVVLAERAKGVRVTGSEPFGSMRIRICGFTGERMVGRPLFLVDGAAVQHTIAHGLDPSRIESISVLKGPQAVEIYGPDARDGAVIVRTKDGSGRGAAPDPAAR